MTKFKIAKMYFANKLKQKDIAKHLACHKNTIYQVIKECKNKSPDSKIWDYLHNRKNNINSTELLELFSFLKNQSKKPKSNKNSIKKNSLEESLVLKIFNDEKYGANRMRSHLKRKGYDVLNIFTIGKLKGLYKRIGLKTKKIRSSNGERRASYQYSLIAAFQYLQYDVKVIAGKHSLPRDIYEKFKNSKKLPKYQWTIIDAKTRTRFLAYSYSMSSYFGLQFLKYVLNWLRSNQVLTEIYIQVDMGPEFYSGSKRKQKIWNEEVKEYNAYVYDTEGVKWKQSLVERSHRTDDEEFYCPRGNKINSKSEFIVEAQFWGIYYNNREHSGIGMNNLSPLDKLRELKVISAEKIINFPCIILDDFFKELKIFSYIKACPNNLEMNLKKSQNVLTYYPIAMACS